jgi:hypothetical protein
MRRTRRRGRCAQNSVARRQPRPRGREAGIAAGTDDERIMGDSEPGRIFFNRGEHGNGIRRNKPHASGGQVFPGSQKNYVSVERRGDAGRPRIVIAHDNVAGSGSLEVGDTVRQRLRLSQKVSDAGRRTRTKHLKRCGDIVSAAAQQIKRIGICVAIHRSQIIIDLGGGSGEQRIWKQISGGRRWKKAGRHEEIYPVADGEVGAAGRTHGIGRKAEEAGKNLGVPRPRAGPVAVSARCYCRRDCRIERSKAGRMRAGGRPRKPARVGCAVAKADQLIKVLRRGELRQVKQCSGSKAGLLHSHKCHHPPMRPRFAALNGYHA